MNIIVYDTLCMDDVDYLNLFSLMMMMLLPREFIQGQNKE